MEPRADGGAAQVRAAAWDAPAYVGPFSRKPIGGILTLADGRLTFETDDGTAFDARLDDLDKVGFAQLDTVMKVQVDGRKYRFIFTRPSGAGTPALLAAGNAGDLLGVAGGVGAAVAGTAGAIESRKAAKRFKAALADASS